MSFGRTGMADWCVAWKNSSHEVSIFSDNYVLKFKGKAIPLQVWAGP